MAADTYQNIECRFYRGWLGGTCRPLVSPGRCRGAACRGGPGGADPDTGSPAPQRCQLAGRTNRSSWHKHGLGLHPGCAMFHYRDLERKQLVCRMHCCVIEVKDLFFQHWFGHLAELRTVLAGPAGQWGSYRCIVWGDRDKEAAGPAHTAICPQCGGNKRLAPPLLCVILWLRRGRGPGGCQTPGSAPPLVRRQLLQTGPRHAAAAALQSGETFTSFSSHQSGRCYK